MPRQQTGAVRTKTGQRSRLTPSPTPIVTPRTWEITGGIVTVTALNLLIQKNTSKRKKQRTTSKRETLS